MNKTDFIDFLLEANRAGYANPNVKIVDQPDGAHEIVYKKDGWLFIDYWFGGNPFSGQESFTLDGKAFWAMQYRGWVNEDFNDRAHEIFAFLKQVLLRCTNEEPIRGPKSYTDKEWRYENERSHDLANFTGVENIWHAGKLAYVCHYFGGLVDGSSFNESLMIGKKIEK